MTPRPPRIATWLLRRLGGLLKGSPKAAVTACIAGLIWLTQMASGLNLDACEGRDVSLEKWRTGPPSKALECAVFLT